ncbi:MAG TPA: EF-P lysine aminoacylase EpmA [Pirellulaceae bacterium]
MSRTHHSATNGPIASLVDECAPTASLTMLATRHKLLRRLRQFFDEREFLEVTTPLLSRETVVDRYLEPLRVTLFSDPKECGVGPSYYLQTSPEFHMKRLLVAGATAIYQVTQAFRGGECGARHNPEFTIVEWYRVDDDLDSGMTFLSELVSHVLSVPAAVRRSYQEAFQEFLGIDPLDAPDARLQALARLHGGPPSCEDRDDCLNWLMATRIEPFLGLDRPALVYGYPAAQAALARISPSDPRVADRFEYFYRGVELANGYHELTDPDEWERRERAANQARVASGRPELPLSNLFGAAMRRGLPPCAGVALGFDRLVMVGAEARELAAVMCFPFDRA